MKRLTGIETRYCQIDADSLGAQGIAQCFDILTPVSNLEITHVSYSGSSSDSSDSSGGDGGGGGGVYKALANVIILQVRDHSINNDLHSVNKDPSCRCEEVHDLSFIHRVLPR
jgi:hypothetical protein